MNTVKSLGAMLDCSRDAVYTKETLKEFFALLSEMGYTNVQLYTEDTFEVEGEPYFGYLRGRYSKSELKELDRFASENGLELIPCIQTLAHLGGITRWDEYRPYTDIDDILLIGEERTYTLIENMFRTCSECFTSRRINIGMDEAHMVGLGKYLDKHGFTDRLTLLSKHLRRVLSIAKKYGFRPMMWSDMFFRLVNGGTYGTGGKNELPENIESLVPEGIDLIYWDYDGKDEAHYTSMISAHRKLRRNVVFAGGVWSWSGFVPDNDFAIQVSEAAMRACIAEGVEDVFFTCWKDDGAESSLFSSLPALMCAAEFARGNFDRESIAAKFYQITGISFEDFMSIGKMNLKKENILANPCKYMLYSDPFLGIFDLTVREEKQTFADIAKDLQNLSGGTFGYMFDTLSALCRVMEIKYTVGVKTRAAYGKRDKNALIGIIEDYKELEKRLLDFYEKFRTQWVRECKQNGFEKHDIRIGGLLLRIRDCYRILRDYCDGKIAGIAALEERILLFRPNELPGEVTYHNDWLSTAMIKPKM